MRTLPRILIAIALGAAGLIYTIYVVTGRIPESQQLSGTHLLLLAFLSVIVVVLIAPENLKRLKILELSGFKLELLERVRENQLKQSDALDTISLILPLLLPKTEQAHLTNLLKGTAANYKGGGTLRSELRRLRSIALIEMTGKGYVADLTSDKTFDLSDYVKLTKLGRQWAMQVASLESNNEVDDSDTTTSRKP